MNFSAIRDTLTGTLRGRLVLAVGLVHALMMTLFIGALTIRQGSLIRERQIDEAVALSHALATSGAVWIAADDVAGLQELVDAQKRYPELVFAAIVDHEGRVLASTDRARQGFYMLDIPSEPRQTVIAHSSALVDAAAPAMMGGRHVGWARVGLGQKVANEKLMTLTRNGILYACVAVGLGMAIAWFVGRRITLRLYSVQQVIESIREGNRHARSSLEGIDEAAVMAREFNSMLDALDERDAALRSSEERFRTLIETLHVGVLLQGPRAEMLMSNPKALEMLGLSNDQLLGRTSFHPDWNVIHEDGSPFPGPTHPVPQAIASGKPVRGVVMGVYRPVTQSRVWLLVDAEPELNADGSVRQVICTFSDITERKNAEREIFRINRALRMLSDTSEAMVQMSDEASLLREVCRVAVDVGNYILAWVGFAEDNPEKSIRPAAYAGLDSGYLDSAQLSWDESPRGAGPAGRSIRTGRPALINDTATDENFAPWREAALRRGFKSVLCLPLTLEGRTHGTMTIYAGEVNAFDAAEIEILQELADSLAFALGSLRARVKREQAEEALRKSEARYRATLDNMLEGCILLGFDWTYLYVNEPAARHRREDRQTLTGKNLLRDFPDMEGQDLFARYRRSMEERVTDRFEYLMQFAEGDQTWLEISLAPVPEGILVVSLDTTQRKEAEDALLHSERKLAHHLEQTLFAVIEWDTDFAVRNWNPAAERIFGYTKEEALGKRGPHLVVPPEVAPLVEGVWRDLLAQSGGSYSVNENVTKDGAVIWCEWINTPLLDEMGRITGVMSIANDVTARKQAEQALLRSESRLNEAQRIAHIGNWELNLLNNTLVWSDEIFRMFEIDPKKFGASYEAFLSAIHPDDRAMVDHVFTESVKARTTYDIDHRLLMEDGEIKYVHEQGETYYDEDGKPLRSVGTVQDITARKLAEGEIQRLNAELEERVTVRTAQLEEANKELEAFAYSVSHDLRAPLRHIDGFVSLLSERAGPVLDEQSAHYMSTIAEAAKRMGALIDDLLSFSRMGRSEMSSMRFDLGSLVREVLGELEADTHDRHVNWHVGELPSVTGDRAMLRVVFTNLISNALKFTRQKDPAEIEIGSEENADRREVVIHVRDNGVGFDMKYADKLFGVFQRLHPVNQFEGTGIGLANVRRVIDRHGGRVWAEAEAGKGAVFYVALPQN